MPKGGEMKHYFSDLGQLQLTEGENTKEVHLLPYGEFLHPAYGEIVIDETMIDDFIKNFQDGVRGTELDIDYAHKYDAAKGDKAAGWIQSLSKKPDGLWGLVKFTGEASKEISDGAWKYMSIDYGDEWCNNSKPPQCFDNVLFGAALTNRPFMKSLAPINFSEVFEVPEGKIPQDEAHYRMADDSAYRCANCLFFREGSCLVVDGEIESDYVSNYFRPIMNEVLEHMYTEQLTDGTIKFSTTTNADTPTEEVKHLNEFLQKILEALGVDKTIEEGKEEEAQEVALSEVKKLSEKAATPPPALPVDEKAKQFAEMFPEQAKQLEEQDKQLRENAVDSRLAEYKQIPPATKELLKPYMLKLSESRMELFNGIMEAIQEKGLVQLGEEGSGHVEETDDKEEFLREVKKYRDENEGIAFGEAVKQVSRTHPDLAEAYLKSAKPAEATA